MNPVSWWNDECTKLIRLRKAALKMWRYSRNIVDYIEYKKRVIPVKKYIKKCKADNFRKFVKCRNFETERKVFKTLPQGGVLSYILFIHQ